MNESILANKVKLYFSEIEIIDEESTKSRPLMVHMCENNTGLCVARNYYRYCISFKKTTFYTIYKWRNYYSPNFSYWVYFIFEMTDSSIYKPGNLIYFGNVSLK